MPENLVEKVSPIRLFEILKIFAILLILQVIIIMFIPIWFIGMARYFFLMGIPLSFLLAYYIYLRTQHIEFSYNSEGLAIKQGKAILNAKWEKVTRVLIIKTRTMEFLIRLQLADGTFFDIPASKLKLDPFEFRVKILKLIKESKKSHN